VCDLSRAVTTSRGVTTRVNGRN